jgi:hypothetical protein
MPKKLIQKLRIQLGEGSVYGQVCKHISLSGLPSYDLRGAIADGRMVVITDFTVECAPCGRVYPVRTYREVAVAVKVN